MKKFLILVFLFISISVIISASIRASRAKLDWDADSHNYSATIKLRQGRTYTVKAKRTDKNSKPSMPTFRLFFKDNRNIGDYKDFSVFPSAKSGKTVSWKFKPDEDIVLTKVESKGIAHGLEWIFWLE